MILISIWIKESVFDPKPAVKNKQSRLRRDCSFISFKTDRYFIPANEKGEGIIS